MPLITSLQTVTVFAYGVTSSGKTHTIQGTRAQPGIIPRVVKVRISATIFVMQTNGDLKDLFRRSATIAGTGISLSISYMEIYKEDAYDLLVERESVSVV